MRKSKPESSWLWSLVKLKVSSFFYKLLDFAPTYLLTGKEIANLIHFFASFRMLSAFWIVMDMWPLEVPTNINHTVILFSSFDSIKNNDNIKNNRLLCAWTLKINLFHHNMFVCADKLKC